MKPTDVTKRHVIAAYFEPARANGDESVQVKVGTVQKELGWTNRTPSVFSTLSSREFQREAGVELIEKRGGPASGGPSTSVQFVFRLLDPNPAGQPTKGHKLSAVGSGLDELYGILKEAYEELGGGEAYLKAERNWGPDAWERYEHEKQQDDRS